MRLLVALLLAVGCAAQVPMTQPFGLPLQPRLSWLGNRNAIPGYGLVGAWDLTTDNLLLWSEDFSNAVWIKTVSCDFGIEGPDGLPSAVRVKSIGNVSVDSGLRQSYGAGVALPGRPFASRVWLKGEGENIGKSVRTLLKRRLGRPCYLTVTTVLTGEWQVVDVALTTLADTVGVDYIPVGQLAGGADAVLVWHPQLNSGLTPKPYVMTTDQQSVPNFAPGQTAALQLGSTAGADTNDPARRQAGMVFDGVDDYLTAGTTNLGGVSLFAGPGQAWSVAVLARHASTSGTQTLIARAGATVGDRTFQLYIENGLWRARLRGSAFVALGVPDTEWHLHIVTWDGSAALYYRDTDAPVALIVSPAVEEATEHVLIGARTTANPAALLAGDVAYIGSATRAWKLAEVQAMYRWLKTYFCPTKGITLP